MKRVIYVILLISMFVFGGCDETPSAVLEKEENMTSIYRCLNSGMASEIEGGFLLEVGDETQMMAFFDAEAKAVVPLCTRTDCGHNNSACTAILLGEEAYGAGMYNNALWYVAEGDNYNELSICKAKTTGEDVDILCTLPGNMRPGKAIFYNGYLYIATMAFMVNELGMLGQIEEALYCVNLSSGDTKEIITKHMENAPTCSILGFYEKELYILFSLGSEIYPEGAIVCYNCETEETRKMELRNCNLVSAKMNDKYFIYTGNEEEGSFTAVISLDSGEECDYITSAYDAQIIMYPEEAFLTIDRVQYRYNFAERILENLEAATSGDCFVPYYSDGGGYLGYLVENDYMTELAYIDKDSFNQGKEPIILTKNGLPIQ